MNIHDGHIRPITRDAGARPLVDVVIEIPRWSFLKRGSQGDIDFVSPLPCPFNYGSVPEYIGLEGDLLDALVLGPRLPLGTHVRVPAWGAIRLMDRGLSDDKLVCSVVPPSQLELQRVLGFFQFYAKCKALLNALRGQFGRNACDGWCDAGSGSGSYEADYIEWLTFSDNAQAVVDDVNRIRHHPLVPGRIPIYGYIYDVATGRLVEVPAATEAGKAV